MQKGGKREKNQWFRGVGQSKEKMRENTQGNDGIKYLRAERHDISNYKGLRRNTPGSNNFRRLVTSFLHVRTLRIKKIFWTQRNQISQRGH